MAIAPPFSRSARYYDALYAQKDYRAEAELYHSKMVGARKNWNTGDSDELLEFGCGTGNFSKHFTERGWRVTGVDPSKEMLDIAKGRGVKPVEASLDSAWLTKGYDTALGFRSWNAACAPFAVFCYAATGSLSQCMKNLSLLLVPSGVFVCDVTNYAAAVTSLLAFERRDADLPDGGAIRRVARKRFCPTTAKLSYSFEFTAWDSRGRAECWYEEHTLRTFTPAEIARIFHDAGFGVSVTNMRGENEIAPDDWSFMVVATKKRDR